MGPTHLILFRKKVYRTGPGLPCDQIGRFVSILGYKSSQIFVDVQGYFERHPCYVKTVVATLGKIWATFYSHSRPANDITDVTHGVVSDAFNDVLVSDAVYDVVVSDAANDVVNR